MSCAFVLECITCEERVSFPADTSGVKSIKWSNICWTPLCLNIYCWIMEWWFSNQWQMTLSQYQGREKFHLCRQYVIVPPGPLPAKVHISRQHCRLNICSYFGWPAKIHLSISLSISRGSTDTDSRKEGPVPLYHISDIRTIGLHWQRLSAETIANNICRHQHRCRHAYFANDKNLRQIHKYIALCAMPWQ